MRCLLLLLVCFTLGCSSIGHILKNEKERSVKKDAMEVLDEQFEGRFIAALDKEIPSEVRGTIKLVVNHVGKLIAALFAAIAAKYGLQVNLQKKHIAKMANTGNGKSS